MTVIVATHSQAGWNITATTSLRRRNWFPPMISYLLSAVQPYSRESMHEGDVKADIPTCENAALVTLHSRAPTSSILRTCMMRSW